MSPSGAMKIGIILLSMKPGCRPIVLKRSETEIVRAENAIKEATGKQPVGFRVGFLLDIDFLKYWSQWLSLTLQRCLPTWCLWQNVLLLEIIEQGGRKRPE
jgi:hypothetical protein